MARFDVHKLKNSDIYVLDCQTDLLSNIDSRFVVPLIAAEKLPVAAKQLNPVFTIGGNSYIMLTQSAAAVSIRELGQVVISLAQNDREILNALDFLITGV